MAEFLTSDALDTAYKGWYYTILGAGGDLNEWFEGYQDLLNKEGIGQISQWFMTSGKAVNDRYGLKGNNAFPSDLTILLFPLDGLNSGKLAMFRLRMGDKWFNDLIDNSVDSEVA